MNIFRGDWQRGVRQPPTWAYSARTSQSVSHTRSCSPQTFFKNPKATENCGFSTVRGTEPKYIKGPPVWLNKGCYLDEVATPSDGMAIAKPEQHDPATVSPETWRRRVETFMREGLTNPSAPWPEQHWGPAPGKPGCCVPPEILKPKPNGSRDNRDQQAA